MLKYQEPELFLRAAGIKLLAIYVLNVADLIFTRILLATGRFVEANLLMAPIITNTISVLLKVGLAAALLLWLYYRLHYSKPEQHGIIATALNICLSLYLLVNISHAIWLLTLL